MHKYSLRTAFVADIAPCSHTNQSSAMPPCKKKGASEDYLELAREYISIDANSDTRGEIQTLLDAGDTASLEKVLSTRLEFGTAGLRGPMAAGMNRMNGLTIMQTTQGLAKYLQECFGDEEAKKQGVVIGYDHRAVANTDPEGAPSSLSSQTFSRQCAAAFLEAGFKVYMLEQLVPTPFVAFGVTHLQCCCGIMITASHNPKADNGFKVYWSNGAQIIPPHDTGISRHIEENLRPWPAAGYDLSEQAVMGHALTEDATEKVSNAYYAALMTLQGACAKTAAVPASGSAVKIAYTAMHGVGGKWIGKAFEMYHPGSTGGKGAIDLLNVPSQFEPDPEFPTVVFPNPEEKGALDQAQAFASSQDCGFIIANDPDADRLAVAEWDAANSKWKVFSGNNLGVLLAHWQIMQYKKGPANVNGAAVLTTVVSSRMLKAIAAAEGITYSDTLTGFKWIGNRALELKAQGMSVLFSYEEALGYCTGDILCDKDGVSAACVFAEMKLHLASLSTPLTVQDHLQNLYGQYGEFVSFNSYVFCHDKPLIADIFARLRKGNGVDNYWAECAGCTITSIHDITNGYDSSTANKVSALPATPGSEMIMFEFSNDVSITLRTSGTEPKIKFYTEIQGKAGDTTEQLTSKLVSFVEDVIEDMLQWKVHNLARP